MMWVAIICCFISLIWRFYQWCHLCSDGHNILVTCNSCGSATCQGCVPSLSTWLLLPAGHKFKCVRCIHRNEKFYVSFESASLTKLIQEFQGIYKPDGTPLFPSGMEITAHNPTNPQKQQVRAPSLVIIEFILDTLPHIGTAGQLLYLSLMQNYGVNPSDLYHQMIFFDVVNGMPLKKHKKLVSNVVKDFWER